MMAKTANQSDSPEKSEFSEFISPIEDVIEDARNGRMYILVDAEDRENEGDLIIPSQMATPEAINFMAKYGRGLICLSLDRSRAEQLNLEMMASGDNSSRHQTAFTVSIEAREGVSTGISAHDRAHTVAVAIDPTKGRPDIVTPGHVFPLVARDGGVLVRAGHTEAAVDISRLAGLYPSGVICEIMNDDGTMARMPDLVKFAQLHDLKVGTIADLIAYRMRHDHLIKRVAEGDFPNTHGTGFKMIVYANIADYAEHIVLVKGDITPDEPVLVRMHAINIMEDILGFKGKPTDQITESIKTIDRAGRGVVVIIRDTKPTAVSERIKAAQSTEPTKKPPLREYGVGAQILLDLGVRDMILLSNTPKRAIVGIEGYGLRVLGQQPIGESSTPD